MVENDRAFTNNINAWLV